MHTQSIDRALLVSLRARGITQAVVNYSGGNDDGGCDDVRVTLADGTEATLENAYVSTADGTDWQVDADGKIIPAGTKVTHHFTRDQNGHRSWYAPATEQEVADFELIGALCQPVDDKYGSWAGEFSAHGTLTYLVDSGELQIEAWETTYTESAGW